MCHTKIDQKYAVWITVFLFTIVVEVAKTEVIPDNSTLIRTSQNGCTCIEYNCGCCEHLEWDAFSLNGTICTNVTYLARDYGFAATVTYNNLAIINETLSARNPPPICVGEDVIENLPAEVCFRLYDIEIREPNYHVCFELEAKFALLRVVTLHLGCLDSNNSTSSVAPLKSHMGTFQNNAYMFIFSVILLCIMTN